MKTKVLILLASLPVALFASNTRRDFFTPNQGVYVRADAASARLGGSIGCDYYGADVALGVRFAETEYTYQGVEFRTGGLFGKFSESGSFKVQGTDVKYSADVVNTALPVIGEYSVAYKVDDDFSVYATAGAGVLFINQTAKNVKVSGLTVNGDTDISGMAPVASIGLGMRYAISKRLELDVGYRYLRVFGYTREADISINGTSHHVEDKTEATNGHALIVGLAYKF